MVDIKKTSQTSDLNWDALKTEFQLSERQIEQFSLYLDFLLKSNEEFNLTAIVQPKEVIAHHFYDSLIVSKFVDIPSMRNICDVGTGGGFPGIPLKILYPEVPMILLEVNKKKINFLWQTIDLLKLDVIEVCDMDWRTFLRKTDWDIDLFLSRASLHTDELMRLLAPGSRYNYAQLIYWASKDWQMGKKEAPFFDREESYTVKGKLRRLIFFKNKTST